jgi:hypothetical protein
MPPLNQPTHAEVALVVLKEINRKTNATHMCVRAFIRYALGRNLKGMMFNSISYLKRKHLLYALRLLRNNGVIQIVNGRILFDFLILNEYPSSQFISIHKEKEEENNIGEAATDEIAVEEVSGNAAAHTVQSSTENDTIRNKEDNECLVYVESFGGFIDSGLIESHFQNIM